MFVIQCMEQWIIKHIEFCYFRRPFQSVYYVEVMCLTVCDTVSASNH